jgi:Lar family restriction alleviation protein
VTTVELKNCPWCGTTAHLHINSPSVYWNTVACALCSVEGPASETTDAAILAWNRRASPWKPICTAPKDGTPVLLYWPGTGGWLPKMYYACWDTTVGETINGQRMGLWSIGFKNYLDPTAVTHYAPLPDDPPSPSSDASP